MWRPPSRQTRGSVSRSSKLDWPTGVVVRIEERVPVGWLETEEGWGLCGGWCPVGHRPDPDSSMPWIQLGPVPIDETESSRTSSDRSNSPPSAR